MTATPANLAAVPPTAAATPAPPATCASCGAPLSGRFCSACGEQKLEPHQLTLRHFLTDSLVPEIVNLDGKIWRTLRKLLFRPGALALAYVAGRRRKYVQPLRVLFTAIIVFVLAMPGGLGFTLGAGPIALSVVPSTLPSSGSIRGTFDQIDRFGMLERMFTARVGPVETAPADVARRFREMLGDFVTPVSFMTVVMLSIVLYALFHRRRPLLVEHAVLSMHYFSFVLLTTLIDLVALKAGVFRSMVGMLSVMLGVVLWQGAYLVVALRRFYWDPDARGVRPWAQAAGAALLLYVANSLFITVVQLVGGAIAIWRL